MSATAVQEIIERIKQLPETDRRLLEQRLAEMVEAEWRSAADEARQTARGKGVDQAAIDRAIEQLRRTA
jgi:hypothetical protein